MRKLLTLAFVLFLSVAAFPTPAQAAISGPGTPFSSSATADNTPAGCATDMVDGPDADVRRNWIDATPEVAPVCHHMRVDMNALDSPQVDVLILVPVSPTAERDIRIIRQSVLMWESGIDSIAPRIGLQWLADGVDFHVTVDTIDPAGADGGEFTTYPVVDPEIVIVVSNPVGGAGIGIDPRDFTADLYEIIFGPSSGETVRQGACHGVANPFDLQAWEALPGFDSHHDGRGGTYVEDCGGAGGNICFAINGGIDPAPAEFGEVYSLYDLVSHEFGHCMSVGHVGDGAEGGWGKLPPNDIMAYSADPPGRNKCVSTLDVEGVAIRMSRYLDVDGNGAVTAADRLFPNDPVGDAPAGDFEPFQTQHPSNHWYDGPTGNAMDCPQPDQATLQGVGLPGPDAPPGGALQSGKPVEVTVGMGEDLLFHIDVPAGASSLTTEFHAKCLPSVHAGVSCTGDVDLYTRLGAAPTDTTYACRPYSTMFDEVCTTVAPGAGRWYVRLYGFLGSTGLTLTSTIGALGDADGDGVTDGADDDRDGDLIPNDIEILLGTDPDAADEVSPPAAPSASACRTSKNVAVEDRDGDGLKAVYAHGTGQTATVNGDGSTSTGTWAGSCWLAGDVDDDGEARSPDGTPAPPLAGCDKGKRVQVEDRDGDGTPAIYVGPDACWLAGDADDEHGSSAAAFSVTSNGAAVDALVGLLQQR